MRSLKSISCAAGRRTEALSGKRILRCCHEWSRTIDSSAEQHLACELRTVPGDVETGDRIPESEALRAAMSSPEYLIPEVLRENHAEWKHESVDAVFPDCCIKTADREIEFAGACIVISDQTMVPVPAHIHVAATANAIESMQCKIGKLAGQTMNRVPDGGNHGGRLHVALRKETIQWAYHVAFGPPGESREC